jgi:hypothetical protein
VKEPVILLSLTPPREGGGGGYIDEVSKLRK